MAGFIFYRGKSIINGAAIIGVAILGSKNKKTGLNVVQCYIMPDGISPLEASKTGQDVSVCGGCKHRGKPTDDPARKQATERSCYVLLGQGPTIVFKGLQRGIYPVADESMMQRMLKGKMIRLGAWGDPAAIPLDVWQSMLACDVAGHTGYTHNAIYQPAITNVCMVSADSIDEVSKGKRTFRVIALKDANKPLHSNEIYCPSAKVQCSACRLCNGTNDNNTKVKSIAILAHGSGSKYV